MLARKIVAAVGACALVAAAGVSQAQGASAAGSSTCSGGPVAHGSYATLKIAGFCALDDGNVSATNVVLLPGSALFGMFAGSNLTVARNVDVQAGATLVLGCEPDFFTCFNDDSNTLSTNDSIGQNLTAEGALAVIVHHTTVNGNVTVTGGGGGINCDSQDVLEGSPAYLTFENVTIGRNASITGWQSCWAGFFRNIVSGNVTYANNLLFDPDGNEVATNSIGRNLNCLGNDPAPQVGDSGGAPNDVSGHATGQCAGLAG